MINEARKKYLKEYRERNRKKLKAKALAIKKARQKQEKKEMEHRLKWVFDTTDNLDSERDFGISRDIMSKVAAIKAARSKK